MKLSLRWRITLLTGMIILLAAVSLTVLSMYNANNTFSMISQITVFFYRNIYAPTLAAMLISQIWTG